MRAPVHPRQSSTPLAVALALDLLVGEPPTRFHPVVWIGNLISFLERRAPAAPTAARLAYGAGMVAIVMGTSAVLAKTAKQSLGQLGFTGALILGALLKPTFAIRELLAAAGRVRAALAQDDLAGARYALRSLVSRDPTELDAPLVAAAAAESVAENLGDSIVAPLFWYALAGLPGAYAYRALNTMDAMIGYRTPEYEHLGKAAARLDDLANLIPSRLTAALLVVAAPFAGGSARVAWHTARRDHALTASPNAGWPMSAAAGALGVSLEKVGHYRLNSSGRPPTVQDLTRTLTLARGAVSIAVPLVLAIDSLASRWFVSRKRRRAAPCGLPNDRTARDKPLPYAA